MVASCSKEAHLTVRFSTNEDEMIDLPVVSSSWWLKLDRNALFCPIRLVRVHNRTERRSVWAFGLSTPNKWNKAYNPSYRPVVASRAPAVLSIFASIFWNHTSQNITHQFKTTSEKKIDRKSRRRRKKKTGPISFGSKLNTKFFIQCVCYATEAHNLLSFPSKKTFLTV